ncbi:hypothetical protein WJX72_001705 [[Myrmecia] bisecta]|uniref:Surfeit locus protein 6 n=1 Tax=[Myrmecia] bisecta TaxID=41462 RepID=A0AAW1PGV8_9CHLO
MLTHSRFFDNLVDLIPAKHYLEQNPDTQLNTRYLKKGEKVAVKQQLKEKYKHNKRTKLDPDAAHTTSSVQQQNTAQTKPAKGGTTNTTEAAKPAVAELPSKGLRLSNNAGSVAGVDDLREKLQKRLQTLRAQRNAHEKQQQLQSAKAWRQQAAERSAARLKEAAQKEAAQKRKAASAEGQPAKKRKEAQGNAEPELAFGRLELGTEGKPGGKSRKDKKATKAELLAQAEAKQQQRQTLAASQDGKEQVRQEAWQAAMSRAKGEKVLDDPKLLRRSLKKEAKLKQKKTAAWQGRLQKQKQDQAAKQSKRTENLAARAQAKAEKKKLKREKKLLRAGFEGRKEGFIQKG